MEAESYPRSPSTLNRTKYKVSESAVREYVNVALGEDRQKPVSRSLYQFLLQCMAEAASKYASGKPDIDEFEFEHDLLNRGLNVIDNLRSSLVKDWNDKTLNFWDSYASPMDKIKAGKVPYMVRSGIEEVVGEYLALPYRSQPIDRFLVRILVAVELFAFGDEMLNGEKDAFIPGRSPLKQRHVLLSYLGGQISNAVLFGVIAAVAIWAHSNVWIGETALAWTIGVCALLFLLGFAISTFALPSAWLMQGKARTRVTELLTTMSAVYSDLRSDGPISAQYIRGRATDASAKGVGWPAPLFALLDDIISRSGRF
jgi:hypothetical protein